MQFFRGHYQVQGEGVYRVQREILLKIRYKAVPYSATLLFF